MKKNLYIVRCGEVALKGMNKPNRERIEKSESALDVDALVVNAVESEEIIEIRP